MFKNKKGFTLIELLVVIAIIGLLSTLAVVALSSARTKARDSKRTADMKQVQTAMEMVFSEANSYVLAGCTSAGNKVSVCTTPLSTYLPNVANLKDPKGTSACATACDGTITAACDYSVVTVPTSSTYSFCFYLETATGDLAAGAHTVTPAGIQ